MTTHVTRARLGALAALMAAALLSGPATATAAPSQNGLDNGIERHVPAHAASAAAYWTEERMRSAIPADVLVADNARAAKNATPGKPVEAGQPQRVQAQKPKATGLSPISHVGKVFFTLGGGNYVCSGNAVSSANELTVSTAGHCVNEGGGAYASRWIFVPAYENGRAPYGQWTATELITTSAWANSGDISYDGAFAVMAPLNGRTLSDTVGATGVGFNLSRGLAYDAFGYPAARPFNGETLQGCTGAARPDPYNQTLSQGIPCDMTGGSSGGPWFTQGLQNSVNSFGYSGVRNTMFGPYFGTAIQQAYQAAAN